MSDSIQDNVQRLLQPYHRTHAIRYAAAVGACLQGDNVAKWWRGKRWSQYPAVPPFWGAGLTLAWVAVGPHPAPCRTSVVPSRHAGGVFQPVTGACYRLLSSGEGGAGLRVASRRGAQCRARSAIAPLSTRVSVRARAGQESP
jgi:hypothetical protein